MAGAQISRPGASPSHSLEVMSREDTRSEVWRPHTGSLTPLGPPFLSLKMEQIAALLTHRLVDN